MLKLLSSPEFICRINTLHDGFRDNSVVHSNVQRVIQGYTLSLPQKKVHINTEQMQWLMSPISATVVRQPSTEISFYGITCQKQDMIMKHTVVGALG